MKTLAFACFVALVMVVSAQEKQSEVTPIFSDSIIKSWAYRTLKSELREQSEWEAERFGKASIQMKRIAAIVITALLAGCTTKPSVQANAFEAMPSPIDQGIDKASIEDYILALPPFEFHEETVAQFTERVRHARTTEKANEGRSLDFLFVRGDGIAPSKEFVLDRRLRVLTIKSMNWEPGMTDDVITMRRVPGGWMRGPRIGMKTAEQQAVAPNR